MITAVLVIAAATGVYAAAAPALVRRLPPAWAVRLVGPASVAVAAAGWFAIAVVGFTWVGQAPEIAELGPWSPHTLRSDSPVPQAAAVGASVLFTVIAGVVCVAVVRRGVQIARVHRACAPLGAPGSLVVVDAQTPNAFTTPEHRGRIVVTSGMIRALEVEEREALFAHERCHQAHHHAWWNLAADLSAAANPLLAPVSRALRHAVERWADEDAAIAVGDRHLVARTLARAALARQHHLRAAAVTAATGGEVPARIAALLEPPRSRRLLAIAVLSVLLAVCASATLAIQRDGESLFEHVMKAHQADPGSAQTAPAAHPDR